MVARPQEEQFFPTFAGSEATRLLNLLVNTNPITFGIRAFFLTNPSLAASLGPTADAIIRSQNLPGNLFDPTRRTRRPFLIGDRVKSRSRSWPESQLFGGYILVIDGEWALIQWDFVPLGPLTYDPLSVIQPQSL